MSSGLFREGGERNIDRTEPNEYITKIKIPTDAQGMVASVLVSIVLK